MSQDLVHTLRVRAGDVGRSADVAPYVILRYFEDARWDAIGGGVEALGQLVGGGTQFVIRAQTLRVLRRPQPREQIESRTWIQRVGRTSFSFGHHLRDAEGHLLAESTAVCVRIDNAGRPTPVPEAMRDHVSSRDVRAVPALTESPPSDAWSMSRLTRPSDIDMLQHMNQSNYLAAVEDTLAVALDAGVYATTPSLTGALAQVSLAHDHELRSGQRYDVVTWRLDDGASLGFVFRDQTQVYARARVLTPA